MSDTESTPVGDGVVRISWTADHDHRRRPAHGRLRASTRAPTGSRRTSTPRTRPPSVWRRSPGCARRGSRAGSTRASDRIVYARLAYDTPADRAGGLPRPAQLLPPPQARDQPAADPRPGRPGAALPADLQARLGPARRRGRGRRVAPARRRPARSRRSSRCRSRPARCCSPTGCPPWGGWDDALCLVFDGGVHDASLVDRIVRQEREIRSAAFCTLEEVRERCADFTARRIASALAQPRRRGPGVRRVRRGA